MRDGKDFCCTGDTLFWVEKVARASRRIENAPTSLSRSTYSAFWPLERSGYNTVGLLFYFWPPCLGW